MGGVTDEPEPRPALTVAAVARRLGIAPSTLRTWDRRYGVGPGSHTAGRHRRYGAADVARLELMHQELLRGAAPAEAARHALAAPVGAPQRAPVASPAAASPAPATGHQGRVVRVGRTVLQLPAASGRARGLAHAALALDGAAVHRVLHEAVAADGLVHAWDHTVRPVLAAVAQRWASTGIGVEIEHLLSERVSAVSAQVTAGAPPARNARPVLLACAPEEMHGLPLDVLAAVLAHRAVGTRLLGTALPADALAAAVRRCAPSVLLLWAQLGGHGDPGLVRGVPRIRPTVRIFVGGPGWAEADLPAQVEVLGSLAVAADRIAAAALGTGTPDAEPR